MFVRSFVLSVFLSFFSSRGYGTNEKCTVVEEGHDARGEVVGGDDFGELADQAQQAQRRLFAHKRTRLAAARRRAGGRAGGREDKAKFEGEKIIKVEQSKAKQNKAKESNAEHK